MYNEIYYVTILKDKNHHNHYKFAPLLFFSVQKSSLKTLLMFIFKSDEVKKDIMS